MSIVFVWKRTELSPLETLRNAVNESGIKLFFTVYKIYCSGNETQNSRYYSGNQSDLDLVTWSRSDCITKLIRFLPRAYGISFLNKIDQIKCQQSFRNLALSEI